MTTNNKFLMGSDDDVEFFTSNHVEASSYTLKRDLIINASKIDDDSYTPIILDDGFIFDGAYHTIVIKYDDDDQDKTNPFQGIFNVVMGSLKNIKVEVLYGIKLSVEPMGAGFIAGAYAGSGDGCSCTIMNCFVDGDIIFDDICQHAGGGIVGAYAGSMYGECYIINCAVNGNIYGYGTGGIAGTGAGSLDGLCEITNCTSSGNIFGPMSGGIVGAYAGTGSQINDHYLFGLCIVLNCDAFGNMYGFGCSSIVGGYASNGICENSNGMTIVMNCSSNGSIDGTYCGGILGYMSGIGGYCSVVNCVVIGDINGLNCGGIVAGNVGNSEDTHRLIGVESINENDTAVEILEKINPNLLAKLDASRLELLSKLDRSFISKLNLNMIARLTGDAPDKISLFRIQEMRFNDDLIQRTKKLKNGSNLRSLTPLTDFTPISGVVVDHCVVTSDNSLPGCSSGRIAGAHSIVTITNSYYYTEFQCYLSVIAGEDSIITEDPSNPNHPLRNTNSLTLYHDKNLIEQYEYNGIHALVIDDDSFDYDARIKKIYFLKHRNNVHPLMVPLAPINDPPTIRTQRQESYQPAYNVHQIDNIYFEIKACSAPSGKDMILWIPNALNNCNDTYSVVYKGDNIGNLELLNDISTADFENINDSPLPKVCNLWRFTFPDIESECDKYIFYVIKN